MGIDVLIDKRDAHKKAVAADPRYGAALSAWVRCVSAQGYDYQSPDDPLAEFEATLSSFERGADGLMTAAAQVERSAQQAREIKIATHTFDCYAEFRRSYRVVYDSTVSQ